MAEEKRRNIPKKERGELIDHKVPPLKYTNYHSLNAPQDHIYVVSNKNLFRRPDEIRGNKSRRDVRKNYAYHKDIGHNTVKCDALRDKIERLIRVGHFREFLENKPQVATINERPHQRSLVRIREVLTVFGGPHVVGDSSNARDKHAKKARSACLTHLQKSTQLKARRKLEDVVFT